MIPTVTRQHKGHLVELIADRGLALEEEKGSVLDLVVFEVAITEHRDAPLRAKPVVDTGLLVLDVANDEVGRVVDNVDIHLPFDAIEFLALATLLVSRTLQL